MNIVETLTGQTAEHLAEGHLVFLGGLFTLIAIVVLVVAGLFAYRSVRKKMSMGRWRILVSLRMVLAILLGLLLGVPVLRVLNQRDGLYVAVMVDSSRSMSIEDVPNEETEIPRIEAARKLLEGDDGLLAALGDVHPVIYSFSEGLKRVPNAADLNAEGPVTNYFAAVRDADSDLRGLPLAAAVMISDGGRNAGGPESEAAFLLKQRGVPLYTIGVGSDQPSLDIEIMRVEAPKMVRRNTQVMARVAVRRVAYEKPFTINITRGGITLASKEVTPDGSSELDLVTIPFTPDSEGAQTYRAEIAALEGERITANNNHDFTIDLNDDRLPVLYVEGSPRTEFRFLRQSLFRDRDFRVVSILRLLGNNFYVQGAAEGESYLTQGFPKTKEQLFAYQAIIIGSIEASYFSEEQLKLLESFVRQGGGLLLLGGSSSFGSGGYATTPLAKALPFQISPRDGDYRPGIYPLTIVDENREHTLLRLTADRSRTRQLWDQAPPLIGISPVGPLRLSAQRLITNKSGDTVLAAHNYGAGRVAAFTSSGSWYWKMNLPSEIDFHEKFWKQTLRWLAVGAQERLTVDIESSLFSRGAPVTIRATVLAKDLQPINDAQVICSITNQTGTSEEMDMDWILREDGVYECRYIPVDEGDYQVSVRLEGAEENTVRSIFSIHEPLIEFSNATLQADRLQALASATGGIYAPLNKAKEDIFPQLEAVLKAVAMRGQEPEDLPLWNMPSLLALLILVAAAEWALRRRWGLA